MHPSLQCNISWNNVEGLMNISHKLCVPALQQECLTFLLTHAAGKPIKAMRIAELFEEEELYRESSRFVLDNPGGWSEEELSTLSQETLLKLEKRFAITTHWLFSAWISDHSLLVQAQLVPRTGLETRPDTSGQGISMCALFSSPPPLGLTTISPYGSAHRVQTHPIAPVYSKRNGDRLTTPSLDSVRHPPFQPLTTYPKKKPTLPPF